MRRWGAGVALAAVTAVGCTPVHPGTADDAAAIVQQWQARSGAPAVVAAIGRPGEDVVVLPAGTDASGAPVAADDRFRIASITKLFVATVVLQLVDEGRLALDDPAAAHLPDVDLVRGVSVRQLLDHTSGIPDCSSVPGVADSLLDDRDRRWTAREVVATVADVLPEFAPGTAFSYSNTNYVLLGMLVEATTGRPWADEVRERIIEPLGLAHTTIPSHGEPPAQVVAGWFDADNDGDTEDVEGAPWPALETFEGAAGAIVSTAGDVAAATRAMLDGTLLPDDLLAEMTAAGPGGRRYDGYGLGVELTHPDRATLVVGHGGFLPGFRSVTWEVEGTVISVLANESRVDPTDLAELLARHVDRLR